MSFKVVIHLILSFGVDVSRNNVHVTLTIFPTLPAHPHLCIVLSHIIFVVPWALQLSTCISNIQISQVHEACLDSADVVNRVIS